MARLRKFLKMIFTWWHSQTIGTALYTLRHGVLRGRDDAGNRYYTNRADTRRWVVYNGEVEASRVPPLWHAWLHFTASTPPAAHTALPYSWSKPHSPNMTGTDAAHRPHANRRYRPSHYTAWDSKVARHKQEA